jgi:hypothetical protein
MESFATRHRDKARLGGDETLSRASCALRTSEGGKASGTATAHLWAGGKRVRMGSLYWRLQVTAD